MFLKKVFLFSYVLFFLQIFKEKINEMWRSPKILTFEIGYFSDDGVWCEYAFHPILERSEHSNQHSELSRCAALKVFLVVHVFYPFTLVGDDPIWLPSWKLTIIPSQNTFEDDIPFPKGGIC